MSKKHIFLSIFSKIAIFVCVFCAFFISPVFATLPAGYTELEYIESTGTQYIDTVTKLNNSIDFETKLTVKPQSGGIHSYFGCWNVWNSSGRSCPNISTYASYRVPTSFEAGFSPSFGTDIGVREGQTGIFSLKGNNISWSEGSSATFDRGAEFITKNIILFATSGSSIMEHSSYPMYYFKIWDNSVLVRNFIPAKRNSDGEIGMYDMVSNTFFTNQGTGDFIAGPEKSISEIKIATTKFVDDEFAAAEANLAATVQTIESVVSRTIAQTGQIQVLQDTKQTRPDESCPANMKCLLVQDEDGTPHWYPIIEP